MAYVDPQYLRRVRINAGEQYEMKVWCELFNCDSKTLMEIISRVGNNAGKVKVALKSSKHA